LLLPKHYGSLLGAFHSKSINLGDLRVLWGQLVFKLFGDKVYTVNGRPLCVVDGFKAPKEGKCMPGVKSLHQESQNNSKPEYIMGHSCQVISLLVKGTGATLAVPLAGAIHEGIKNSPAEKATLYNKFLDLLASLNLKKELYVVADCYYAVSKVVQGFQVAGHHLVSRVRGNAVAYEQVVEKKQKGRGRPKIYGRKIKLKKFFNNHDKFTEASSQVYNETNVKIKYYTEDLLWRSAGCLARFVWVIHPTRGKIILVSDDVTLDPLKIIEIYGLRFKCEVGLKVAARIVGAFKYHFWMKGMKKTHRGGGDQFLHRTTKVYKQAVFRKLGAYQLHIQVGLIAQGLIQYIAVAYNIQLWSSYNGYIRTMNTDRCPSEEVTAHVLRDSLPKFLLNLPKDHKMKKFLDGKTKIARCAYCSMDG
jgi:hypothetical protein